MGNTEFNQKFMMNESTGSDAWVPEILQFLTLCAASVSPEQGTERTWMMKCGLVLWEAPNWSKMDWFEFQFLYVSPAHLLVLPLMSSKLANREEEEWQLAYSGPDEELLSTSGALGFH